MEFAHRSVLLQETVENLITDRDGIYVDGTLGGGGHSLEILKHLTAKGRLIGIDRDEEAIEAATKRLEAYEEQVAIVHANYGDMAEVLRNRGIEKVSGIVLDLGVSSHQLDDADRGFSYMQDAPLDMRMDRTEKGTAADIVNGYSKEELARVIREYGEDRFANRIADNIVKVRSGKPISTTGELVEIIRSSIPLKVQKTGGHPAKRTFQAIRIELNGELTTLENSLDQMIDMLDDGGRLAVITFHSLEDRIVKETFRRNENPCTCPPSFPVCVCGKKPKGRVILRKGVVPSEEEMRENSRAKSARLRIFERVIAGENG